ncbi:hypothetical protein [Nocardia wallacei]|uniref:hypothetical protein n=1 Tax=Nocardia wallacei TaxID=480035 RepID=UPI002455A11A|nr:hypothetical protein [Nocardia wallacei]
MPGAGMMPGGRKADDAEHKSPEMLRGQHLEGWIAGGRVLPAASAIGEREEPAQQYPPPAPEPPPAPKPKPKPKKPGRGRPRGEHR